MPDFSFEQRLWDDGITLIAGIDEAGRGPLAGPVSAAAVVLPKDFTNNLLDDSKKITEKKREQLYTELTSDDSIKWSVSLVDEQEIDSINILKATHLAMAKSVKQLISTDCSVEFCLIDGLNVPRFPYASKGIVKGDALSLSIAAASIIAKVTRDRKMQEYAIMYPQYGFEKHKGYGTKQHLAALELHGPTPIHRRSFSPIAKFYDSGDSFKLRSE